MGLTDVTLRRMRGWPRCSASDQSDRTDDLDRSGAGDGSMGSFGDCDVEQRDHRAWRDVEQQVGWGFGLRVWERRRRGFRWVSLPA